MPGGDVQTCWPQVAPWHLATLVPGWLLASTAGYADWGPGAEQSRSLDGGFLHCWLVAVTLVVVLAACGGGTELRTCTLVTSSRAICLLPTRLTRDEHSEWGELATQQLSPACHATCGQHVAARPCECKWIVQRANKFSRRLLIAQCTLLWGSVHCGSRIAMQNACATCPPQSATRSSCCVTMDMTAPNELYLYGAPAARAVALGDVGLPSSS